MTQHLIRRLDEGEAAAAALARQLGVICRDRPRPRLPPLLVCERKKWSQEASAYNGARRRLARASCGWLRPAAAAQPQTSMDL